MSYKEPFHFDSHGVNDAEGQRIAKVCSCEPYTYETGRPIRNKEFDRLSNLFAAAPEMLTTLSQNLDTLKIVESVLAERGIELKEVTRQIARNELVIAKAKE